MSVGAGPVQGEAADDVVASGRRVLLRTPRPADAPLLLAAVQRSRRLHAPWVSPPATPQAYSRFLEQLQLPQNHGWLVVHRRSGELAGVINLTNIVMGVFRSGYLGYYAFEGHARQGLMGEALRLVVRHAFGALHLHRLEANMQPGNLASIALVRRAGFRQEGYSPRYLKIGGRWRDHERWALVKR